MTGNQKIILTILVVYLLLIVISFIFLYPVLYMLSRSLMSRNRVFSAALNTLAS